MTEFEDFDIDLKDIFELSDEEKEEVRKQINALSNQAACLQEKAQELGVVDNLL